MHHARQSILLTRARVGNKGTCDSSTVRLGASFWKRRQYARRHHPRREKKNPEWQQRLLKQSELRAEGHTQNRCVHPPCGGARNAVGKKCSLMYVQGQPLNGRQSKFYAAVGQEAFNFCALVYSPERRHVSISMLPASYGCAQTVLFFGRHRSSAIT